MPRRGRSIFGRTPAKERLSDCRFMLCPVHEPGCPLPPDFLWGFVETGDLHVQQPVWPANEPGMHTAYMFATVRTLTLLSMVLFSGAAALEQNTAQSNSAPEYTSDARLRFPEKYREWVYLTSGFDMSYDPAMQMGDQHKFDNVFANPGAYGSFVKTGTWPDKTMLVLEERGAKGKGSINQKGNYQGGIVGLAVHVRDEARFAGKWAFFGFDGSKTAKMIPLSADCYSCHAAHAAVDTTFVQFYPTLLPIATTKGTLAAPYLTETAGK
jgi:hypothetical protein